MPLSSSAVHCVERRSTVTARDLYVRITYPSLRQHFHALAECFAGRSQPPIETEQQAAGDAIGRDRGSSHRDRLDTIELVAKRLRPFPVQELLEGQGLQ